MSARTSTASCVVLAALLATTACGSGEGGSGDRELVVFAASSLSETFTVLAERFEAANPGTRVVLSNGASSTLAQQVVGGAPADVFAAASPATMAVVIAAGAAAGEPVVFARNRLQIAVPKGNPGRVAALADLARTELDVALCAAQVPCGAAAARAFARAGLRAAPDTLEQDVKAVLAKVRLGEVDAGLVYATDVRAAGGDVEGVAFPESQAAENDYPVVVLDGADDAQAAAQFVALLTSPEGRAVLTAAGFSTPPSTAPPSTAAS